MLQIDTCVSIDVFMEVLIQLVCIFLYLYIPNTFINNRLLVKLTVTTFSSLAKKIFFRILGSVTVSADCISELCVLVSRANR